MSEFENQTQAERLAGAIANGILSGEFEPGLRLDEQTLAERFNVSRTPVREAIRQLEATGLISRRPRRGARVTLMTADELDRLFVAMGEMEATCARLAAIRMTPIERRRLQALHERMGEMADRRDRDGYADANVEFHTAIYAGAHNSVLDEFTTALRRRLAPFRLAQFQAAGRLPRSHAEHGAIVSAVLAGDAAQAHAAMLHHVSLVEDAFGQVNPVHAERPGPGIERSRVAHASSAGTPRRKAGSRAAKR